jgi:hypothetical protein
MSPFAGGPEGPLLTLSEIAELTGIHPTLLRHYRERLGPALPAVGGNGEERFARPAVGLFREAHSEAQRGSVAGAGREPAGEAATPRWRLLSLPSQRRRPAPPASPAPAVGEPTNGIRERPAAAARVEAPDPPPPPPVPAAGPARPRAEELPPPPARRPTRRLFTLQQVHERTGIPYPTLAFYAASEADHIPAAGERYAPLYPWEAMAAFCTLHRQRNPSWQPPALPPAPPPEAPRGDGLSDRLEALESAQIALVDEIRAFLEDEGDGPLMGTAS